jgi:hypothetical protein
MPFSIGSALLADRARGLCRRLRGARTSARRSRSCSRCRASRSACLRLEPALGVDLQLVQVSKPARERGELQLVAVHLIFEKSGSPVGVMTVPVMRACCCLSNRSACDILPSMNVAALGRPVTIEAICLAEFRRETGSVCVAHGGSRGWMTQCRCRSNAPQLRHFSGISSVRAPAISGTSPTEQAFRGVVPLTTFRIAEEADL